MNTTMAPVEQIRQSLDGLRRRHNSRHVISRRRIDRRTAYVIVERQRDNKDTNSNNRDGGVAIIRDVNDSNGGSNGDRKSGDSSSNRIRPNFFDRNRPSRSSDSSLATTSGAAGPSRTETPLVPEISMMTPAVPNPSPAPDTSLSLSSPGTASSASSSTVAPEASQLAVPNAKSTDSKSTESATLPAVDVSIGPTSTGAIPGITGADPTPTVSLVTEAGPTFSATAVANAAANTLPANNNPAADDMSPLAERLLIAAGAIGAFIIILAAIWFIFRIRHKEFLPARPRRRSRKSRSSPWPDTQSRRQTLHTDSPPKYSGEQASFVEIPPEKKLTPQNEAETSTSQRAIPSLAPTKMAITVSNADHRRQEQTRKPLPSSSVPIAPVQSQNSPRTRPVTGVNEILLANGLLARQLADSYKSPQRQNTGASHDLLDNYNNTGTQVTMLTRQTTNIQTASEREPNRASELSSLSSGFGDGLIIQEGGPPIVAGRQSRVQRSSRFSWQTSVPRNSRTSVITTSSVDSSPRFRSVNSWVAQQSGRVERQENMAAEVPNLPSIPPPLRMGQQQQHRRKESQISAFQAHPGDQVDIRQGTRVPSSILDNKIRYT